MKISSCGKEYRLKMNSIPVTLIIIYAAAFQICFSQMIIPRRPFGYIYQNGSNDAPIHLDIHMGPLCPASRNALPVAKQVADYYRASVLKLTLHMFPLPYHHNSYFVAQGAQVVRSLGTVDTAFAWFDTIYANLDILSTETTENITAYNVIKMLSGFAAKIGVDANMFLNKMSMDEDLETATRAAWKYSCSRAISGTPTYLLNDVIIEADPSWTLSDWRSVIDQLLITKIIKYQDCPAGTFKCEYLPGKIQCCTNGEKCVLNVGCRCFDDLSKSKDCRATNEILPIT